MNLLLPGKYNLTDDFTNLKEFKRNVVLLLSNTYTITTTGTSYELKNHLLLYLHANGLIMTWGV